MNTGLKCPKVCPDKGVKKGSLSGLGIRVFAKEFTQLGSLSGLSGLFPDKHQFWGVFDSRVGKTLGKMAMTEHEILETLPGSQIVDAYTEGYTLYLRLSSGHLFAIEPSEWLTLCETRICASCQMTVPIWSGGFCARCGKPA